MKIFHFLLREDRAHRRLGIVARHVHKSAHTAVRRPDQRPAGFDSPNPPQFVMLERLDGLAIPAVLGDVHEEVRILVVFRALFRIGCGWVGYGDRDFIPGGATIAVGNSYGDSAALCADGYGTQAGVNGAAQSRAAD